ncbi:MULTISPECIES: tail fiber domain-containing protein [unclassified Sphingobium]|uniref:tail fiber domain-containing protein n=1 Tax=unclassified Sphingobium TaxID=2611147 RepID=UPI0035A6D27B
MGITGLEMADLVREVCYDGGTGPLTPGGAMAGFRAFADAVGEGEAFPYVIVGVTHPEQWETGSGSLDGLGRIVRMPAASSAGGAAVDFLSGEKRIALTLHAGWAQAVEAHGHGIGDVAGLASALAGVQPRDGRLDALAGVSAAADSLAYWTGTASADVTPITAFGRSLLGQVDAAAARGVIGLGSIATQGAGSVAISGGTISGLASLASTGTVTRQGSGVVSFIADRTSSNLNSAMEFKTTAGSVFVGNKDGASFGISGSSNLSTGNWLTVTSTGVSAPGVTTANAQLTGGSATGLSALGVTQGAAAASVTIDSNAGQFAGVSLRSGTSLRWTLRKSNGAESGSAAGSDFVLHRHDDSGVALGAAFQISRASGMSQFDGVVAPLTDNARTLGTAGQRWSVVYAATGTVNTSDARAKRDVGAVDAALLDAWGDVGWRVFRFVDAWAAKGEAARWHVGLIAQEVRDAIDARLGTGAAVRLGLLCHDEWDSQNDEDGAEVRPAADRWGLRYEEIFALEAAWQRRRIDRIEALLEAGDAG